MRDAEPHVGEGSAVGLRLVGWAEGDAEGEGVLAAHGQKTAPLTDVQKSVAIPYALPPEHRQEDQWPGMLTVCGENTLTFSIALGPSNEAQAHCTAFAHVGPGSGVLHVISHVATDPKGAPRANIEITKIPTVYETLRNLQVTFAPPKDPVVVN